MLIETARLHLRRLAVSDLDALVELHAQPAVSRFVGPLDREAAAAHLSADEDEWRRRGHGLMAVVARDTGRFLGRAGLKYWPQFGETEVGWVLHPDAWGNGYATEAARACAAWGFERLDVPYLTAMIRPDNIRSLRVAERLRMTPMREDVLSSVPVVVHAVDRARWEHGRDQA